MNEQNVRLWIEALRSDEFDQGTTKLTKIDDDGYETDCCLGVACKVAIKHGVPLKVEIRASSSVDSVAYKAYGETEEDEWLPNEIKDWLGLDSRDPVLALDKFESLTATELNDDRGYDFDQIADAVEAKLNGNS